MEIIKKYIGKYRRGKANRELIKNLSFFVSITLLIFISLITIEKLFYLSTYTRKNYFILFLAIVCVLSIYTLISWIINYRGIFGVNSDEIIAQEIGKKNLSIKDHLLNVIQLNESHKNSDLTKLAIKGIELDIKKIKAKYFELFQLRTIYLFLFTCLLSIGIIISTDINKAAYRLINYNKDYTPPTPFRLNNITNKISALSGDSIDFRIQGIGNLPDSISLYWKIGNNSYNKRINQKNDVYSYKLNNINSDVTYWGIYKAYSVFSPWDSIGTKPSTILVKKRPLLLKNKFIVIPPIYTDTKIEEYLGTNSTQIDVLKGSNIKLIFEFDTSLESSWMLVDNQRVFLEIADNIIHGDFMFNDKIKLRIYCLNKNMIPNLNPIQFSFNKIEDFSPSITINTPEKEFEINESYKIYMNFNITDDYGIDDVWLEYNIVSPGFSTDNPINQISFKDRLTEKEKELNIVYDWDIDNLGILMGDEIHFWIVAKDNDPHKTEPIRTDQFIGKFPSLEDLFFELENKEKESYDWLENIKETIEDISDITDEVELELLKEENISFENEKKIESSFERIENISNEIEKIRENIEKIIENAEKNNLFDENLIKKFNEFQNILKDIMTPELMQAMQKLKDALKNMDADEIAKALDNFEFNLEEFEDQLDRYIEMFKMALAEQKLNELSKMIENLVDKQNELNNQINNKSSILRALNSKANKQEQEYNNFKNLLKEAINDISGVSENTSQKLEDLSEDSIIEDTSQKLDEVKKELSKENMNKAAKSAENTYRNLEKIKEQINEIQKEFINQEMQEITDSFIAIINDLLTISNQQENIISISKNIRSNSPLIVGINEKQNNVSRELDKLMDQLIILSNKTFFITPPINRAFGKSKMAIANVINNFEQKKIKPATVSQKESLKNINLVTQLLMDALNQLKDNNSPSGIEQFMESMQQLTQQQEGLNQSTLQLSQLGMMQQQNLLEGLQSQQEQLKEQLEELLKEFPGEDNGTMEKIGKDMEEIIQDFKNKIINRETISRQERILSRMLDNQRSLTQKDFSNKRKSKTGGEFIYIGDKNLPQNLGDKNLLLINAMESAMEEGFSIEYNKLIRNYFLNLQKEEGADE